MYGEVNSIHGQILCMGMDEEDTSNLPEGLIDQKPLGYQLRPMLKIHGHTRQEKDEKEPY